MTRAGRRAVWIRAGMACLPAAILSILAVGCIRKDPTPYRPERPILARDARVGFLLGDGEFPERALSDPSCWLDAPEPSPPAVLAWLDALFRDLAEAASLKRTPERLAALAAERTEIEKEIDGLGLTGASVMRRRFDRPRDGEAERFRRAARLRLRIGLSLMREGTADARVAAAAEFEQAVDWDPETPLPALLLATYRDGAGFRSNALAGLEQFSREHGQTDLIDLAILRRRTRLYKLHHRFEDIDAAFRVADRACARHPAPPPWITLEKAKGLYLADSLEAAAVDAGLALEQCGVPPADTVVALEAELLLGVLETRALEYRSADWHFARAMELSHQCRLASELATWLDLPWDLLSEKERFDYDKSADRGEWLERYWRASDPIHATPAVLENRTEYRRRVGEAHFSFSGVDPATPGPITEPGRAVLRFGWPSNWIQQAGVTAPGSSTGLLDYGVYETWEFRYDFLRAGAMSERPGGRLRPGPWNSSVVVDERRSRRSIIFQERPGTSRFVATDSLRPPGWPNYLFNYDFRGRGYLLNLDVARFRAGDGRARLCLSYDTYMPDYSVRFPLQGLRFDGEAQVDFTLYRETPITRADGTRTGMLSEARTTRALLLEHELELKREWTFRRRAAFAHLDDVDTGLVRVASLLSLRDADQRVIAMAVDNGDTLRVPNFGANGLDASDLFLMSSLPDSLPEETEQLVEGGRRYGYDLDRLRFVPRAGRLFLPEESLAFYFEVYGFGLANGRPRVRFSTSLERLFEDGELDYRVTLRAVSQSLNRPGIRQWNVARSFGFGDIGEGRYRLVVEVEDEVSGNTVTRASEFRVVGARELAALYRWNEFPAPFRPKSARN